MAEGTAGKFLIEMLYTSKSGADCSPRAPLQGPSRSRYTRRYVGTAKQPARSASTICDVWIVISPYVVQRGDIFC